MAGRGGYPRSDHNCVVGHDQDCAVPRPAGTQSAPGGLNGVSTMRIASVLTSIALAGFIATGVATAATTAATTTAPAATTAAPAKKSAASAMTPEKTAISKQ